MLDNAALNAFIEAKRQDPSWFDCPKLHCFMPRSDCAARYRNANFSNYNDTHYRIGFHDPGCMTCRIGKAHYEKCEVPELPPRGRWRESLRGKVCHLCGQKAYATKVSGIEVGIICQHHYKVIYGRIRRTGSPYKKDGRL